MWRSTTIRMPRIPPSVMTIPAVVMVDVQMEMEEWEKVWVETWVKVV